MSKCIVKGFIIPKNGANNKPIFTKEFSKEESIFLYKRYKDFLIAFRDAYLKLNSIDKFRTAEDLEDFLNSFIFYLKSILIIDPIPNDLEFIKEKILPSPTIILRGLLINEIDREVNKLIKAIENLLGLEDSLERLINIYYNYLSELNKINTISKNLFEELNILDFPADTRVGSNTSSLIIHMLTVSAIAIAIYLERYRNLYGKKDLLVLRFCSLFHDVGKMYNWHTHETESAKLLRELFENSCLDEAKEVIENAANVIERKGGKRLTDIHNIFIDADKKASSLDRVQELILELVSEDSRDIIEEKVNKWKNSGYSNPFIEWGFWEEFTCEDIKKFTEEFCRNASKIVRDNPALDILNDKGEIKDEIINEDIRIVRIDLKSIQSFIHSNEIRVMNGASRLVDLIVFILIPLYVVKCIKLPAESILYFGGGNITLVIPKYMLEQRDELRKNIIDKLCDHFSSIITLQYGSSQFYSRLTSINYEIDRELQKRKLCSNITSSIKPNIHKRCKSCSTNEITVIEDHSNVHKKEKDMCEKCRIKFKIGNTWHFARRTKSILEIDDNDINKILDKILEYISGSKEDEILNNKIDKYKDIAFIKFDGNILGQLMASSISLTDAHERSIRIDYSVKKAFHSFLYKLQNEGLDEYAKRISMGLMYMGGDDGAILMPSVVSIPFALHIINEYYYNMGRKSTLSIGIAVAKPKHPVQLLKEGAEYLLDITKEDVRGFAYMVHSSPNPEDYNFRGALTFYIADGGKFNKDALESIFNKLREQSLSIQPYLVGNNNNSINRLLNIILCSEPNEDPIDILLSYLNINNIKFNDKYLELLKDIRNNCLKNIQVNINGVNDLWLRVIYSVRESNNKILKKILNNLFIVNNNKPYFALYDLYQLLEVMGVEQY